MIDRYPLRWLWLAGCCYGCVLSCTTASYTAAADREVDEILRVSTDRELGLRESQALLPEWTTDQAKNTVEPLESSGSGSQAGATEPQADGSKGKQTDESAGSQAGEPTGNAVGRTSAVPDDPQDSGIPQDSGPPQDSGIDPSVPRYLDMDLAAVLNLAVRQNREYLTRRETLYREGLSISLARFQFGPQFNAALSFLWPRGEGGINSRRAGANFSASQILPTGGTLSLAAGLNGDWPNDRGAFNDPAFGTNVGLSLNQPLLRGAGYVPSHEPLTSAERGLIYAIRNFELFRQDFTIRIARQFFELNSQRTQLSNQDTNYDAAVFDRRKAQALAAVGRGSEQEVFLARRREIVAKDRLINARASYERAVDSFKIELGVATTTPLELAEIAPPYDPIQFEVTSAIDAALHNRLDLITQRQTVQDQERRLRIAENGLLPDLDLTANYGYSGVGDTLNHSMPETWDASLGLNFELPLQRKAERNSYRSAQISLEQARRALQLQEDQLKLQIRNAVRQLRSIEERIILQEAQIKQEQRVVTVTQIRYESGKVGNRNLLDARQAFVDAQNALINLKVDHFVARLNLLKDLGLLFINEDGMWREGIQR